MARGDLVSFAAALSAVALLFVGYLHFGNPTTRFGGRPTLQTQRARDDDSVLTVERSDASTNTGLLGPAGRICCKALTAKCMACTTGKSIDTYCKTNPDTMGCPQKKKPAPGTGTATPKDASAESAAAVESTMGGGETTMGGAKKAVYDPVVVGDCVGNNFGRLLHPRKFYSELAQATFPNRKVVVNELSKSCTPTEKSKYDRTDMIVIVWSQYDDRHKTAIVDAPESERIRWNEDPKFPNGTVQNVKGLLSYSKSRVVRHSLGRTFMIALNDEAYGQSGALYDLMIEAKLEPKYVHRHTTNLWWPLASRFLLQNGWPQSTPNDLLVPKDFDADAELKSRTAFCVFRHKHCDKGFYKEGTGAATRVALFDAIKEHYKPCLSLGMCRHDPDARAKYNVPAGNEYQAGAKVRDTSGGLDFTTSSVMTFKQFKFSFAVENSFANGYWTEKITNGILARTVPIVVGIRPPNETLLHQYINMDRIIYCQMPAAKYANSPGFSDAKPNARIDHVKTTMVDELKDCVNKIKKVDQDDTLFKKIISTPFLKDNTLDAANSLFSFPIYGKYIRQSLREHESYLMEGEPEEDE